MSQPETITADHNHEVVPEKEWIVARKGFRKKEKEFTRLRDRLNRERRQLPWTKVEKNCLFEGPKGTETLLEDETDAIFHTYSSYGRGGDILIGTYNYLDLTPFGRQEAQGQGMEGVRYHDSYGDDR